MARAISSPPSPLPTRFACQSLRRFCFSSPFFPGQFLPSSHLRVNIVLPPPRVSRVEEKKRARLLRHPGVCVEKMDGKVPLIAVIKHVPDVALHGALSCPEAIKGTLEDEEIIFTGRLKTVLPRTIRNLIRTNKLSITNTSGMAEGFKQANIIILHKSLADDFEKFCQANDGPLPLLYRSDPGEWKCPPLSNNSDIRTDCLQYRKYENGECTGLLKNLKEYSEQLKDMVTFYLGCSFTFEKLLQKAGVPVRNVEQKCNVSMYKTAVPCYGTEKFNCNLVVSMRPIPKDKLDIAVQTTYPLKKSHGAPVHIGSPDFLGIRDLSSPSYGDTVQAQPGDVPVFWACGVTGAEAVCNCKIDIGGAIILDGPQASILFYYVPCSGCDYTIKCFEIVYETKSPLAFTHSPGCMFISDLKDIDDDNAPACGRDPPEVCCIGWNPLHYSIASATAVQKIRCLEDMIGIDPGNRGVKHLCSQNELLKACLSISHAQSVLITTGFPTHFKYEPPEENDGPPGAIAMAAMLKALGKNVSIVTDQRALSLNKKIIKEAVEQGILETPIPIISYCSHSTDSALKFLCEDGDTNKPKFNHLIAIERAGMAADGNYYNARKINIKHLVDPIDELFLAAKMIPGITTTGIGDGGNELGMGKVKEAVKKYIANGDVIACDVEADFAVVAGVSNWGGYAVACALYVLNTCEIHDRYLRKAVGFSRLSRKVDWTSALPSVAKEEKLLNILQQNQVRSGVTASLEMEVDGLPFYTVHSCLLEKLLEETLK